MPKYAKKVLSIFISLLLSLSLFGCKSEFADSARGLASLISKSFQVEAQGAEDIVLSTPNPNFAEKTNNSAVSAETRNFTVHYTQTKRAAALEPASGCLFGADISKNPVFSTISGINITSFESMSKTSLNIYALTTRLGADFPLSFVLNCLSSGKIPHITMLPPEGGTPYNYPLLEKTAKSYATLQTPIFIRFYPYAIGRGFSPDTYREFFDYAHQLFAEYCPQAAFVWSVSAASLENSRFYFPGNDSVDWIGLELYSKLQKNDNEYELSEIFHYLKTFTNLYGNTAPLFISEFGVSHYSTIDNKYRTNEAAQIITDIYSQIANNYPQIRGIIYSDFSKDGEDFSVTTVPSLLTAFSDTLNNYTQIPTFANFVEKVYTSSFYAVLMDNLLYIDSRTLTDELKLSPVLSTKIFDGTKFFLLSNVESSLNMSSSVNFIDNTIFLYN